MSFKDEYKKSYDDIVPDKEFVKQLSEKMNREQSKRQKISYRIVTVLLSAVLIFFVGFGAFQLIKGFSKPSKSIQVRTGKSIPAVSSEIGDFVPKKWYNPEDKAEKILSDFLKRLGDEEQLLALYQSTENTFAEEQTVSETEIHQMTKELQAATVVPEKKKSQPVGTYYMAEFQNGDIIKFVMTEDGYFWFLDLEYVYQW